jgi:hypothetical protein
MALVTLKIPDEHHHKVRAAASLKGQTVKEYCADAIVASVAWLNDVGPLRTGTRHPETPTTRTGPCPEEG